MAIQTPATAHSIFKSLLTLLECV